MAALLIGEAEMPVSQGTVGLDILTTVLVGRPVSEEQVRQLVETRVEETLYLEYKRGSWFDNQPDRAKLLREYTSGFANAEGGLLVIGIVGGEKSQGAAAWSFEGPKCPSAAGWGDWLDSALRPVTVKARVRYQVVDCAGHPVVLIGVDRAEALIRLYEKPNLICYLRIGTENLPIDETLYADLVLGRRAKPDLELEAHAPRAVRDALGARVLVGASVHNHGLIWVSEYKAALVQYGHPTQSAKPSSTVLRHLEVREPFPEDSGLQVTAQDLRAAAVTLRPFESIRFQHQAEIPSSPVEWLWAAAILFVPSNGPPLWAQVVAEGIGPLLKRVGHTHALVGRAPWIVWTSGSAVDRLRGELDGELGAAGLRWETLIASAA